MGRTCVHKELTYLRKQKKTGVTAMHIMSVIMLQNLITVIVKGTTWQSGKIGQGFCSLYSEQLEDTDVS